MVRNSILAIVTIAQVQIDPISTARQFFFLENQEPDVLCKFDLYEVCGNKM